ncbi:thiamine pyrophosphate-dependent dehydrogenase E1 component subunit alpha [Tepidanaerobacter syntrophicus]|uniref:Pyruvate dehydrogenase E1 component alpha subunit n=1 Tax=Tepidanaerobacter syntrophicus TaxID=224999 RepID=A0A0U9HGB3_9FIRM|nr:thiamine pyrophosphate-dependent dehydrogenase E1 component subunit alpha [Tepidanaerobacter syntrophicus]GAQ25845.1 pyruvate dehydrogenase E1 component alpha subunit [Tepidanaerobacter syntrophicus]
MSKVVEPIEDWGKYPKDFVLNIYKTLVLERSVDDAILGLIKEGRTGSHHPGKGEEAPAAGVMPTLRKDDYVYYHHRGVNTQVARGMSLVDIFGDFLGTMAGSTRGFGAGIIHMIEPSLGMLGQSGTLGGCFPLATGTGISIQFRKTDQVVAVFFGDGTANRGTWQESINVCSYRKLPVIFILQNNGYAMSVSEKNVSARKEYLADRAEGFGVPGYVVKDGNNPLTIYETMKECVDRARRGDGPSMIQVDTYRHYGHFVGDDGISYRDPKEVEEWIKRDPLKISYDRLFAAGYITQKEAEEIKAEAVKKIKEAIDIAAAAPQPGKERIFQGLFAE